MRLQPKVCAVLAVVMLCGSVGAVAAAPPGSATGSASDVQAQVRQVDAKVAVARARQTTLQAQVSQLERQNAAQQKQLQQRDAEIAALQQKLQAAGGPAPASSAGH